MAETVIAPVVAPVVAPLPGTPEYNAAMVARAELAAGKPAAAAVAVRPEHVPEKFWDAATGTVRADDLAKSYAELSKKLGAPAAPKADLSVTPVVDTAAAVTGAGFDFAALNAEYAEKGDLTPETRAALAAKGFDAAAVDTYIAGAKANAAAYDQAAFAVAGGADAFKALATWAGQTMTPAEATAFNAAVTSNDISKMKLAVFELRGKYEAANGKAPALVTGGNLPTGDVAAFANLHQLSMAQRDPRYKTDSAYRAQVEARARISKL